ncbi:DegT/DnrJ/EryC1/StrS family aminotransferase [Streptomyces purpureus]|uniref:Aminotransferase n=1 Tax=Streptomyces purpureus TaxID=1951 RepID=A0A918LMI4_9ACTN|nr:DegT/DnrJ/EryC1/StrS family aminotransferase [Streptomyces purpureus]GGT19145.1 aminotransferase [Streptomyces purpureus]
MKVPFLDLKAPHAEIRAELDEAYHRVVDSGWFLLGEETTAFESEFAAYCGAEHCVSVGSGCDALELTLRALGIGAGDEVIVPSATYIATWLSVSETGATPVPVEADDATQLLDPALVEAAITPATRAIMPVHLYGQSADLAALRRIADRHGLALVDDAAQAHGARHRGQRIGTGTTATAFSFYPGKNLGALGDGGAVTTSDGELAERIRLLRNYGSRRKYHHELRATNSRLDELQAALLRAKLPHLDRWNHRRGEIAARYLADLAGLPGIRLPRVAAWAEHAWHLFVIRCADRDALQRSLTEAGVGTLVHYPVPVHLSQAYADDATWPAGTYPIAESIAAQVLSLPMGPHLSDDDVTHVIAAVRAAALNPTR